MSNVTPISKQNFIANLNVGDAINDIFLISSAQQGKAKNGPYWRIECKDATGSLLAKIWSPLSLSINNLEAGMFVSIKGKIISYNNNSELAIDSLIILSKEESNNLSLVDFLPASEYDPNVMLASLKDICKKELTHKPWLKFVNLLLNDEEICSRFLVAPAAKAMHHPYASGLLEHTLSVVNVCMMLASHYPQLDRQALLVGAICHDLGKMWELTYGTSIDYSTEGRLVGHISIILEKINPFLKKSQLEPELIEHLKHLILSHHGYLEYGSPKLPATAEAFILHYADNIDAKMNQIQSALSSINDGETGWSSYIPSLERALYKPSVTPNSKAESQANNDKNNIMQQLLPLV